MEGWVDLGYPTMHRPGVELAIFPSRVRHRNHYTTEPPRCSQQRVKCWRSSKFTDMFNPDCADDNVVNAAVDVLPGVSLTVPTPHQSTSRFTFSHFNPFTPLRDENFNMTPQTDNIKIYAQKKVRGMGAYPNCDLFLIQWRLKLIKSPCRPSSGDSY